MSERCPDCRHRWDWHPDAAEAALGVQCAVLDCSCDSVRPGLAPTSSLENLAFARRVASGDLTRAHPR